ncbi:glucokinase [Parasphingorhabdus sp.]|uniref:glucokinase n=1 Tax=Parasphingorhabdus sp. TaxID=2709688 RepID=UPI0032634AC6
MPQEIIVADIGGTHARFAIAVVRNGRVIQLDNQITMNSADHASLQIAWAAYSAAIGRDLPVDGAIAVAAPVGGDVLHLTNSSWMIRPQLICETLKLERFSLVNDFGAVGHAAAWPGDDQFEHICGPESPISEKHSITLIGPGTGLGVAHICRKGDKYHITETEAGHIDFAPRDDFEDRLLHSLRKQHGRVSVERIVAGPGLQLLYRMVAEMDGQQPKQLDDKALWQLASSGEDSLAAAAFERFCLCLGGFAGDMALAHGTDAVVISGGLGNRIAHHLPSSGFHSRFAAKGRFGGLMDQIPVKRFLREEPGLYGAAVAFLKEHEITRPAGNSK